MRNDKTISPLPETDLNAAAGGLRVLSSPWCNDGMTTQTRPTVERSDRVRQVGVTLAEVFCVIGTLVGVGVIGTRVEESSGGALAADATLSAPAGPAFSIWTPIYLGLAAYTVWQWLPQQATDRRHRAIGAERPDLW